jgi:hypothetical protein
METIDKTTKTILKALDTMQLVVMTGFALMFGCIALAALICSFTDFGVFNLLGIIGGGGCAKMCWENRRAE